MQSYFPLYSTKNPQKLFNILLKDFEYHFHYLQFIYKNLKTNKLDSCGSVAALEIYNF